MTDTSDSLPVTRAELLTILGNYQRTPDVIAAEADAAVKVIEAEAAAEVKVMHAATADTEQLIEAEAEADATVVAAADDDGETAAEVLGGSPEPEAAHWWTKSRTK